MLPALTPMQEPALPLTRTDRTGEPFRIRPYEDVDLAALETFYDGFEPKRGAQGLPPQGVDRIRRWLGTVLAQGVHLVALRENRLIGHSFLVPTPRSDTAEYAVFLQATERGRGVGTELNRLAVAAARDAGFRRVWLTVEPHNRAAIGSYENAGFRFRPSTIYSSEMEMEMDL